MARRGLLLMPSEEQARAANVLFDAADTIESVSPTTLGQGVVPATAMDMRRVIVDLLRNMGTARLEARDKAKGRRS